MASNFGQKFPATTQAAIYTEDDIRRVLLNYVETKCCYNSGAAKQMEIMSITMSMAYRYKVEAFMETREIRWVTVPCKTGNSLLRESTFAPPNNAPDMWDVNIQPTEVFKNSTITWEVANTATISDCTTCSNSCGKVRCLTCVGMGSELCQSCTGAGTLVEHLGSGRTQQIVCHWCQGRGRNPCTNCSSAGMIECKGCDGFGKLKTYLELWVTWKNCFERTTVPRGSLQPHHILRAGGDTIVFEMSEEANPLLNFPDAQIRSESIRMFGNHRSLADQQGNHKIRKYRQMLEEILVAEVTFMWESQIEVFYVYGTDKSVYFPKLYPMNCLCCRCPCAIS